MSIETFGVTHQSLRRHMFPGLPGDFSATTAPTRATVEEAISEAGADLAGRLIQEGLNPSTVATGGAAAPAYPNAFAWCQKTIRLSAAIAVLPAATQQDPEVVKAWREELARRYRTLDEFGHVALGDAPAPGTPSNGPLTHIERHNLDTGSEADISSAAPRFRRDDHL